MYLLEMCRVVAIASPTLRSRGKGSKSSCIARHFQSGLYRYIAPAKGPRQILTKRHQGALQSQQEHSGAQLTGGPSLEAGCEEDGGGRKPKLNSFTRMVHLLGEEKDEVPVQPFHA